MPPISPTEPNKYLVSSLSDPEGVKSELLFSGFEPLACLTREQAANQLIQVETCLSGWDADQVRIDLRFKP